MFFLFCFVGFFVGVLVFAWFGLVSLFCLCFFACLRPFTDWCIAQIAVPRAKKRRRRGPRATRSRVRPQTHKDDTPQRCPIYCLPKFHETMQMDLSGSSDLRDCSIVALQRLRNSNVPIQASQASDIGPRTCVRKRRER